MNKQLKKKLRWIRSIKDTIPLIINSDNPILIYQMGKVGSTSILDSITSRWNGPVLHSHHLNDPQEKYIYQNQYCKNKPFYLISLTREPISRNISAYFQNLAYFTKGTPGKGPASTNLLIENFLHKYPHDLPLTWFQNHLERNFDINVFEHPFPDEGFTTMSRDNLKVLIMRAETDDKAKEKAVSSFLQIPNFKLSRSNVGSNKEYAKIYKNFKATLKLSPAYLDRMYGSRYFKHFYSGQIGLELSDRWRNQTV